MGSGSFRARSNGFGERNSWRKEGGPLRVTVEAVDAPMYINLGVGSCCNCVSRYRLRNVGRQLIDLRLVELRKLALIFFSETPEITTDQGSLDPSSSRLRYEISRPSRSDSCRKAGASASKSVSERAAATAIAETVPVHTPKMVRCTSPLQSSG